MTSIHTFLFLVLTLASSKFAISLAMASTKTKHILVTGGNKGIGKAICQTLLETYPEVHVILGSRDIGRGQKAVNDLCAAVPGCQDRLMCVELDVTSDDSVSSAASKVGQMGRKLYGIVNNAGIGFGNTFEDTLGTNYFGVRRVNDAFACHLVRPGGRIVNIASASGPMFVYGLQKGDLKEKLTLPNSNINGGIVELDGIAKSYYGQLDYGNDAYGLSKALLNAYTALHAKVEPELVINSCSPGFINTDITRGMGARNPPSKGAICPVQLLMSESIAKNPTGWYYGSDVIRSPIHCYRDPGEPPYDGP